MEWIRTGSLVLLTACGGGLPPGLAVELDTGAEPVVEAIAELGPVQECSALGEGLTDLADSAEARGVDLEVFGVVAPGPCNWTPGGVVAQDLDLDDDIDLLFNRTDGFPHLYANDGAGGLEAVAVELPWEDVDRPMYTTAAVDLDGDRLPDVVRTGIGFVAVSWNLGDLRFSDWELLFEDAHYSKSCFASAAFGDLDADGDLDLFLPAIDEVPFRGHELTGSDEEWAPAYDVLLENRDGVYVPRDLLSPWGDRPGFSLVGAFTDFDGDGDLDLLQGTDRPDPSLVPPQGLWRNDAVAGEWPVLADVAPEAGADLRVAAMGLGVRDLNQDGALDYCMTDEAPGVTCMLSAGQGSFAVASQAIGLVPDRTTHPDLPDDWHTRPDDVSSTGWVTWGLALEDLDNDGNPDMAVTAGPVPDSGTPARNQQNRWQPDWLFRGVEGGRFEAVDASETAFRSLDFNYGLVSADLDRDGFRELITGPWEGRPQVFDNPCTAGGWLEVDLVGPGLNAEAYGARVVVTHGDQVDQQELHNLLAVGQSPSALHFGLGGAERVDRLEVWWADGMVSVLEDLTPNREVRIWHPEAAATWGVQR